MSDRLNDEQVERAAEEAMENWDGDEAPSLRIPQREPEWRGLQKSEASLEELAAQPKADSGSQESAPAGEGRVKCEVCSRGTAESATNLCERCAASIILVEVPAPISPLDVARNPRDTHGLTVKWHDDDQLFVARILEANWCSGHGDTREAAIAMCEANFRDIPPDWKNSPSQPAPIDVAPKESHGDVVCDDDCDCFFELDPNCKCPCHKPLNVLAEDAPIHTFASIREEFKTYKLGSPEGINRDEWLTVHLLEARNNNTMAVRAMILAQNTLLKAHNTPPAGNESWATIADAIAMLKSAPSLSTEGAGHWIDAKRRLPDHHNMVMVWYVPTKSDGTGCDLDAESYPGMAFWARTEGYGWTRGDGNKANDIFATVTPLATSSCGSPPRLQRRGDDAR